jgi:hypothetical protein
MSTPDAGHDTPTLTSPSAPAVATPPAPARPSGGGKMARRVLFAAGGLALCGGCAALTPVALNSARQYTEDQLRAAFENGVTSARQAVLNDLKQLEVGGEIITLDAAIAAATLTKLAVKYVVGPAATVIVALGVGALDILINALSTVISGIGYIPGGSQFVQPLTQLHDMLTAWRLNLSLLPKEINQYANWDVDSAETYLKALLAKIEAEQQATPGAATPTPTVTATAGQ